MNIRILRVVNLVVGAGLTLALSACVPSEVASGLGGIIPVSSPVPVGGLIQSGAAVAKSLENFTAEEEHYIGRAVAANLLSQYPPLANSQSNRYLNLLGQSLARHSNRPETFGGYRFQLLDSAEVNAFAAPGGLILVTRGLARCATTEEELAAVLAHEIAHVNLSHGIKTIKSARRGQALATIGSLAASQAPLPSQVSAWSSYFSGAVGDILQELTVKGYSRSAEFEADKTAQAILERAGYPQSALAAVLENMAPRVASGAGFGRTHPPAVARRKALGGSADIPANSVRQARFETAMKSIL